MSIARSPRRAWLALSVFPGWALGVGCVPEQPRADDAATVRALELLERVRSDYPSWPRPSGWEERVRASGSHGRYVELYVSPEVESALATEGELSAWPRGSRFVLEGYDDEEDAEPFVLSVLIEDGGTWRWAQYEDEMPVAYGRPTSCIGCHLAADDLVRSLALPVADD